MTQFPGTGQFGTNPGVRVQRVIGGDTFERTGEQDRRRIRWTVYPRENTPQSSTTTATQAWRAVGVQVGDPHPEDPQLLATEFRVQQSRENRFAWQVEWTYLPFSSDDPGGDDPFEPGFVEINVDNEVEFVDFYRQQSDFPPNGQPPLPPVPIITGEVIAVGGRPTSLPIRTIRADISVVINGWPNFPLYALTTARRNSVEFQGGAIGSVLYTGARSNRIGPNTWRVTHQFVQDQFYHMRQIGEFDDEGGLINAYWVQPFRGFADFEAALDLPPL